jgi:hypothetical protein
MPFLKTTSCVIDCAPHARGHPQQNAEDPVEQRLVVAQASRPKWTCRLRALLCCGNRPVCVRRPARSRWRIRTVPERSEHNGCAEVAALERHGHRVAHLGRELRDGLAGWRNARLVRAKRRDNEQRNVGMDLHIASRYRLVVILATLVRGR